MSIVVIGLNHRTAPLELLERMTVSDERLPKLLGDLCEYEHVSEAVVLSTCNRTEVYALAERFHGAYLDIRTWLGDLAYLPPEGFADHLYVHHDDQAVAHLFTVSAGLDSAVIGENEILGQVRNAWELARDEGGAGPSLNLLFRHAIEVGKRVRTETRISRHIASVSQAAVAMAARHLGTLAGKRVLVLGAGDMGEGMASALVDADVEEIVVLNRSLERANELAHRVGGRAAALGDLHRELATADLLLTSTGATATIVEHGDLAPVIGARADQPLLIVDIAVPRDIDPAVGDLAGVTLLDMDDLQAFATAGIRERERERDVVWAIVAEEVERYEAVRSARAVAPLVTDLRVFAEQVRNAELDRFGARLAELDGREREAVEALTRGIVGKLLHDPTIRLKDAAGSPRGERLAESLRELFNL